MNPKGVPFLSPEQATRLTQRPDKTPPAQIWELLNYRPNIWSYAHVHTSGARFNAFSDSRQVGKTTTAEQEVLDALYAPPRENDQTHLRDSDGKILQRNPNNVGVFSDTYEHAELVVIPVIALLVKLIGDTNFSVNMNKHFLKIAGTGAELHWFSAENPLAGEGHVFSFGLFDESQNISDAFWAGVRPAFGARLAPVFAFGTPDPIEESSWFEGLYLRGQDELETNYYSYTMPCWQNKWLPKEDIEDALKTLSEREFRMKYLGEWVKHEGAVFRDPESCFTGTYALPDAANGPNIIGLDLAKQEDFTVAYVFNTKTSTVEHRWRINHLDYVKVADEVEKLYKDYRCSKIRMDDTGLGEPVADMLRHKRLHISPFIFNNKSKERLVSHLAREIEHKRITLPKEDTQLLRELRAFSRKVSKAGNVQFSAPVNFHDDCVMALGLAALDSGRSTNVTVQNYAFAEAVSPW